ncbi:hypothetical protein [Paenibacillus azoreducens]|uniref:Uncharacterized protein n=1 Tax=Paenibacillus azoreducens TaxID=116718 RepID=A0A919YHR2_9BACL|nr:hypothetical protein [Paenibacillus azoreducens]GIO49460.1 hypothetical protein J34TS1_42250 [Paenibacillus azoreducens]
MKFDIRLAKSMMEHEEGMNHLWIQISRDENAAAKPLELQIQLPDGIYRSVNLNGYAENEQKRVMLGPLDTEVLFEIYTEEAIKCGEAAIQVTVFSGEKVITQDISLQLVTEEEMDQVQIDEQVVERVKTLETNSDTCNSCDKNWLPKVRIIQSHELSELEKRYRVDYGNV